MAPGVVEQCRDDRDAVRRDQNLFDVAAHRVVIAEAVPHLLRVPGHNHQRVVQIVRASRLATDWSASARPLRSN